MRDNTSPVRVSKKRIERFSFNEIGDLKTAIEDDPKITESLREDFKRTLEAEGIKVDEEFKRRVQETWRNQIKSDVKRVAETEGRDDWYLRRVLEGKPIRVRVKVNRDSGHTKKPLEGDEK